MTNADVLHQASRVKNYLDAEHFAADDGTFFCSGGRREWQVHQAWCGFQAFQQSLLADH